MCQHSAKHTELGETLPFPSAHHSQEVPLTSLTFVVMLKVGWVSPFYPKKFSVLKITGNKAL